MARYVDADELIRLIEIDALCNGGCFSKRDVIHCIKAINTADVVQKQEVVHAIIVEIVEKLNFSNQIFENCARQLVGPNYVNGRLDAYSEFMDILNGLAGKYLFEEKI